MLKDQDDRYGHEISSYRVQQNPKISSVKSLITLPQWFSAGLFQGCASVAEPVRYTPQWMAHFLALVDREQVSVQELLRASTYAP